VVQPDALPGERLRRPPRGRQGEYHWHKHDDDDEFFFVIEGRFVIDLEDRSSSFNRGRVRRAEGRDPSNPRPGTRGDP
jgi:mannose-6-phosphate isomerase-like protein (cupin superfamily)